MEVQVTNTRTKNLELLNLPRDQLITIYTCGPTVYNRAHIGNLRTFLWSDLIIQYLNKVGYSVRPILNITDVDDKIISRLPEQNLESLLKFTSEYTELFLQDLQNLGIRSFADANIHKVTDNIGPILQMIERLLETGFAYVIPGGSIYFDSSKVGVYPFPDFQKNEDNSGYESERTIIREEGVKSKNDFVLWKVKLDEELKWDPLNYLNNRKIKPGRPGWHIECSAICMQHLGRVDIHMGGLDLKFPHHTCSILQSEAYNPIQIFGKYWFHMGFLNFEGDKMSKSIGNVLRLDDVKDVNDIKQNPILLRWYLLSKPYYSTFHYSAADLNSWKTDFTNFHLLYNKLRYRFFRMANSEKQNYSGNLSIYSEILEIISSNFDVPSALKRINSYVSSLKSVYLSEDAAQQILNELTQVNDLLNLIDPELVELDSETLALVSKREQLRAQKMFEQTDAIRKSLESRFIFEDDRTGCSLINR